MALRLVQYSDVENACDYPDRIGRLAATIRNRPDDALVVGTGDNTSPGVLPLVTDGRQALSFYDAVLPDVETFGNHDFDYGPETTLEIVRESPQTWVSANVRRDGTPFGRDAGVELWTIIERDGVRVGVTGVTTPRTTSLNPMAADLEFTDPVPAVREALSNLRTAGADVLVVCSHLGSADEDLARATEADVILGGHVPSTRLERVDGTLVTRPGDGGHAVVEVTIDDGAATGTVRSTDDSRPAPDVVEAFESMRADAGLEAVLGRVETPIERTEATLFGGESRVGNFVADAYRRHTGADVALQNSGGIRSGAPLAGQVTAADLVSLVPFDEPVGVATVTGAELASVFDEAVGVDLDFAEPDWWHAHVSGVALERRGEDVRVRSVQGEPLEPDRRYTLATSEYLFHTDDEFPTLGPDHRVRGTEQPQYDVLLEYARAEGIDPSIEGRIESVE